jgi:hypothetical protein
MKNLGSKSTNKLTPGTKVPKELSEALLPLLFRAGQCQNQLETTE